MTTNNTPGVYIDEINGFPGTIVPVATAVPAFIGYTPRADVNGESLRNQPVKIASLADFAAYFLLPNLPPPADPAYQYHPQYYLIENALPENTSPPANTPSLYINGTNYTLLPDPGTIYYLYNSVRLFYLNGGGDAWIVSVGPYGAPTGSPLPAATTPLVNPNVQLNDLLGGLQALKDKQEPTLYICPDATLLSVADNATLMQQMLLQASAVQRALCVFDVINGNQPDPVQYTQDIQTFRDSTGNTGLEYGTCYYPFITTTVMQNSEIDFTNLFGGNTHALAPLLDPPQNPNPAARAILASIENPPPSPLSNYALNNALQVASPTYCDIMTLVLNTANCLPTSGAMAGVYATSDSSNGVWNSPANTGIVSAVTLPIRLSDNQQTNLNVDPLTGKSINAIRFFNGLGILVWGARTLDGNSMDWQYLSVRRTMIFLEQSIQNALRNFTFAANDGITWSAVTSSISNFLTSVWKQGGLQGAKPSDAFSVSVGLGSTMTADDVLNGYMNVVVKVAVVHPAEFQVMTFEQQMQNA